MNTTTLVTGYFITYALGSAQTSYGFTGEYTDPSGMMYLRARYYMQNDGRFLTRDTWMGDYSNPLSLNRWMYVEGNPVNLSDPSGHDPWGCEGRPNEAECIKTLTRPRTRIPEWWENNIQVSIDGYGFIDPRHVRRGWDEAAWFVKTIKDTLALGRSLIEYNGMLPMARAESHPNYWVEYAVSEKIQDNQINGVAYGMFIDFERGYEEYQDDQWWNFQWLSGFAPADLPSDHFGFWAFINRYKKYELATLLECLGEPEVLDQQFPGGFLLDSTGIPENREFLPMRRKFIDEIGKYPVTQMENMAWPTGFEIQPIPSGPNTWQVLARSH